MNKFMAIIVFAVGIVISIWGVMTVIDLEANGISAGEVLGAVSISKQDQLKSIK